MRPLLRTLPILLVVLSTAIPAVLAEEISCNSPDGKRRECMANTERGVWLLDRRSEARCRFGESWGVLPGRIWVDRGCRAVFMVNAAGLTSTGEILRCTSEDSRPRECPADTSRGVLLVDRKSRVICRYGENWGFEEGTVWVKNGCRADFRVIRAGGDGGSSGIPAGESRSAVALCQEDIRSRAKEHHGEDAEPQFGATTAERVSGSRLRIRGEGELRPWKERAGFTYECVVDTRSGKVESASWRAR